ncbi:MAG: hypothetical protein AABZ60_24155 [Planctomycetota bacterium]
MAEEKKPPVVSSSTEERLQRRRKMELMLGVCDLLEGEFLGTTTFRGAPCYVIQLDPGAPSSDSILYLPYNDATKLGTEVRTIPTGHFKDENTLTYEHVWFLMKHGTQYFQEKLVIRTSGVDESPKA